MSFELESLEIKGYNNRDIMNKFLKQKKGSGPLSIIIPGLRYNIDMPILYYATGVLLEAGHSVLSVDLRYPETPDFLSVSDQERKDWMFKEADAIYNAVQGLEAYNLSILVGKSLGTILMSHLVHNYPPIQECKMLWLTPLLQNNWVLEQMIAHKGESFVVIGTADTHYDDSKISRLVEEGKCDVMGITRGNHNLDVPGGIISSMEQIISVMKSFKDFIRK